MANKVKALQQWCHLQVLGYRDVNVTNMTSSWKSGLAFCALIHKYRPDLIDYDSLCKENVYENNELAFRVAKEKLNIPDLLDAEDMVAMAVPDKLCIVTYVSQYYNALRSMSPAGGPGVRKSPTKRPLTSEPPGGTEAKRISTEPIKSQENQTKGTSAPRGGHKQSMGDKCHICHQKVYLMERHLEGGKLYHRHCFRESQKSSFRAYRGARHHESKENISPQTSSVNKKPLNQLNGAATNDTANGASAKGMARFWDAKVTGTKRLPSSSSSSSSPSLSGLESPQPQSPESSNKPLKPTSPGEERKSTKTDLLLKARTAKPWSPTAEQQPKTFNYGKLDQKPTEPSFSSSSSSSSSPSSLAARSPVSPPAAWRRGDPSQPPANLSAGVVDLFPHYQTSHTAIRNIPSAAPAETMDVDDASDGDSKLGAASVKRTPSVFTPTATPTVPTPTPAPIPTRPTQPRWASTKAEVATPRSPPPSSRSPPPPPPSSSRSPPPTARGLESNVQPRNEATIVSGLLHSLTNIRQRHDLKRDLTTTSNDPPAGSKQQKKPSSINSVQKSPPSPTKPDQPKSILKSGGGGADAAASASLVADESPSSFSALSKGPRPILKNKDPMSVTVCDAPKTPENQRLRSILKPGTDSLESGAGSSDNSPRSILKRHDDPEDEVHFGIGHGILKTPDPTNTNESSYDSTSPGPRSILKTGLHDPDLSASQEDSPRPGKSILKSRKHSGDSLLSSSGDELEELSPKPILKTSPRSEALVSPTSDRKSILKTKVLSSISPTNTRDSPKPILKSRESSPAPVASSPLKVAEPTKTILKKGVEVPTPTKSAQSQPAKSPSGPSSLRTNGSEDEGQSVSSFAAFKSNTSKGYSSSLGFAEREKPPPHSSVSQVSSLSDRKPAPIKPKPATRHLESKFSPISGAKGKPATLDSREKPSTLAGGGAKLGDGRPEWMKEAEKRQAARGGKYEDPEKVFLEDGGKSSTLSNQGRSFSPPGTFVNGTGDKKKACTIDRPNPFVRKTSPRDEPMEVDNRPEWQKEAEKRQAARKGFYPDPEKVPIRNRTLEPEKVLSNGDEKAKKVPPERPAPSYLGHQTSPSVVNKQLEKDHLKVGTLSDRLPGGKPPPKPLRSPLPQRGFRGSGGEPSQDVNDSAGNARARDTDRDRQAAIRKHPSILQRNKKNPPPPRPLKPPTTLERKTIVPDAEFSFDPIRGKTRPRPGEASSPPGDGLYAEVGPPSRRRPAGSEVPSIHRFSHRPLPPVPKVIADSGEGTPTPKRKVQAEVHIETSTLISRLEDLDVHLQAMEQEGRVLEEKIRSESDDAMDEADLMIAWFELVNQKNELVRQESDLMYRQRQQDLESQHEELEYELRCLMEKTDSEKTPSDRIREEALLQELIQTVMLRNNIVDSIEEDRIRYLEEDEEIAVMMHAKVYSRRLSLKDDTLLDTSPSRKKGKKKKKDDKKKNNRRDVKSSYN